MIREIMCESLGFLDLRLLVKYKALRTFDVPTTFNEMLERIVELIVLSLSGPHLGEVNS
jgi:hypothetical protein